MGLIKFLWWVHFVKPDWYMVNCANNSFGRGFRPLYWTGKWFEDRMGVIIPRRQLGEIRALAKNSVMRGIIEEGQKCSAVASRIRDV